MATPTSSTYLISASSLFPFLRWPPKRLFELHISFGSTRNLHRHGATSVISLSSKTKLRNMDYSSRRGVTFFSDLGCSATYYGVRGAKIYPTFSLSTHTHIGRKISTRTLRRLCPGCQIALLSCVCNPLRTSDRIKQRPVGSLTLNNSTLAMHVPQ